MTEDQEHTEWLASGEPDVLQEMYDRYREKRQAERAVAEIEWTAMLARALDAEEVDGDMSDETLARYELEKAEWRLTYKHLYPKYYKADAKVESPPSAMPMMAGQRRLAEIGAAILAAVPRLARKPQQPTMPETGHALRDAINAALPGMMADPVECSDALALLYLAHEPTYAEVCKLVEVDQTTVKLRANALSDRVHHSLRTFDDWIRDARGQPDSQNTDNTIVLLRRLGLEVRWNAWDERAEIRGGKWSGWTFIDDAVVGQLLTTSRSTEHGYRPGKDTFWDTLTALARANTVDPALDFVDECGAKWDGEERLETWLSDCCGVPDDAYHRAVARHVIGSLVRRIRNPGAKVDSMLVLIGAQGTRKSTLCRLLALRPEWFSDEIKLGDESKELVLSLAGKTVIEVSELDGLGRRDMSAVKAMISRQVDRGRTAYARSVTDRPRRSIFVGSTNDSAPLIDDSGNRRFLPVRIAEHIDTDWLRDNIEQLVGEASWLHEREGDTFELPSDVWADAAAEQEAVRDRPDYEILLSETFARDDGEVFITANDLRQLVQSGLRRPVPAKRYGKFMREQLGFHPTTSRRPGGGTPVAVWCRGSIDAARQYVVRPDGTIILPTVLQAGVLPPTSPLC